MVIDILHPGEVRAAIDTHEVALHSWVFLRPLHAFSIDSAVSGPADLPYSRPFGETAFTTWHLHSRSVYLKRKKTKVIEQDIKGQVLYSNTYLRNGCRGVVFRSHLCPTTARLGFHFFAVSVLSTRCGLS